MRKIFVALLLLIALSSVCYGADSEDKEVYVRQDVFDAKMEALFNKLQMEIVSLRTELKEEINSVRSDVKELSVRMNGFEERVGRLEKNMDTRFSDLRNDIYLGLVILGIIAGLPSLKSFLQWSTEQKQTRQNSITLVK